MFSVCDRNISNKSNVSIFLFGIFLGLIACLNVVGISDGNVYAKSLSKTLVKTNSTSQRSAQSFAYDSDKDKIVVRPEKFFCDGSPEDLFPPTWPTIK